jgi:hypothetical protein
LHEPDAEIIVRAVNELRLPSADPSTSLRTGPIELASAYTDVFLLNVPPYGSVYTGEDGEMNGPEAQRIAALFEAHGYCPPELSGVGAPDHVGLCLGFLGERELEIGELGLDWIPVACLAVEREPSAHPFYRSLAARTRQTLLPRRARHDTPSAIGHPLSADGELSLRNLVRFFLAPARCGVFLSRSRLGQMAKALDMRLPFGSRFDVAEMLFTSAGEAGQVEELIDVLEAEIDDWRLAYRQWAEDDPVWRPFAEMWLARTGTATRTLAEMRETAMTMLT